MSKINQAIYEIRSLDTLANENRWVNRLHPLVKLWVTILYIGITVSFPKYNLSGLLVMAVYPVILFVVGEISFKDSVRRLWLVLPLVCVVGIFNPLFDKDTVAYFGSLAVSGGVISMITLMLKGIFTVLAGYLLIASTTIEKICYALRLLHLPKLFVTQILLIYRYLSVLLAEANRMTQAYALRAPGQKGVHFKVWGSLAGQLLLRSMDRAEELYGSMTLRGFRGEFYYADAPAYGRSGLAFAVVCIALFLGARCFIISSLLGGLLIG